ncbi:restriction endonuclease subunit S [Haemophilus parahaemolyticus]|uniref:Restriction endonuclease subunit S n=1 Tax=Haemophilus parahaemolyticus TaxID=735 RepID=A0A369ZHP7_HAEPH|nr:restriction endonuclease subunit S [Haemophilus parahaemolyticus]RDF04102.1 restriction endonuclease subunit S [Haemophilus parahaemolyticus]
MTEHKKLQPEIRFAGFTDDWEQRKLGEVVEFFSGLTYSPTDVLNNGTLVLRSSNIQDSQIVTDDNVYVRPECVYSQNVEIGDIVVVVRNGSKNLIGKHALVSKQMNNTVIGAFMTGIRSNNPSFFNALLDTSKFNDEIEKNLGATINQITTGAFKSMEFLIPSYEEQTQIGNFFKQLDDTIALHQRTLEKYQKLKISYLEKMFPKGNELYPELRFPNFTDAWEQRKLGEIVDVFDGTHQTPKYTDKGIMFLSVEDIKTLKSEKYISEEDFKKEFKYFPEIGDVLMTRIGDVGTTNVICSTQPIAYYVSLALLKNKNSDPYFLSTVISSGSVQSDIWKRTLHIAFPKKINKSEIEKVIIPLPSYVEQTQIGNFFKQLDDTIALHQQEVEKYKKIKQSYLEKIFI